MKKLNKIIGVFIIALMLFLAPKMILAETIDEVKSSKEIHVKSVPATDERFMFLVGDMFAEEYPGYSIDAFSCNDDYTVCDILKQGVVEVPEVKIIYDYDPAIKKVADSLIKNLKTDEKNMFFLNAVEYIEYYIASYKMYQEWYAEHEDDEEAVEPEPLNMGDYSSELRKFFQYKNFNIRVGMGDDATFFFTQAGDTMFIYDDTLYGVSDMVTVVFRNVIYIPEDTTDIEKAVKDYFAKYYDVKEVTIEEYSVISEMLKNEEKSFEEYYDENDWLHDDFSTKEEYVAAMMDEYYYGENAPGHFLVEAEPNFYSVELDEDKIFSFAIVKDDKKVNAENKMRSSDVGTGVEISTDGVVPLDTLIQVARLTSGDEYDKIVKLLKVTDVEMFDLKLFSKSAEDYITKLDDGEFEVKLPISDAFKDKDLVVYYVDENDKVVEYKVEVKDGYAVFTTDHFSIYTLAAAPEKVDAVDKGTNPKTYDNIFTYISLLAVSLVGVYFVSRKVKSSI